jgi:lipopolysaccharide transport system permease protein
MTICSFRRVFQFPETFFGNFTLFPLKTVISAGSSRFYGLSGLREWSGLLRYLSLRDVYARYKQTAMGFAWSVVRPLLNILIFGTLSWLIDKTQNFSERFLQVSAGIVCWQLFSTVTTESANSLSANAGILTKVYFPRIILPLSSLLVCLVDFLIAFILFLVVFMIIHGPPAWQILFLPLILAYGLIFSFGFGLIFATGSVRYRDVRFILPFIVQVLFYLSPVFISTSFVLALNIPSWMKSLYQINPFVPVLNGFKYCIYGTMEPLDPSCTGISVLLSVAILAASLYYFNRFERNFADYI